MDFNDAVAAQLRAERAIARITIDELVARTGISKSSILRYLNGDRDITLNTVATIAKAIGVPHLSVLAAAESRVDEAQTQEEPEASTPAGTTSTSAVPARPAHAPSRSRARGARGTTEQHKS